MLGPLEVRHQGRPVDLGGPKQRALLAVLAVDANRIVSLDRIIDELWGDEPPAAATGTLQSYVSHLRRILEPDRPPRVAPAVLVTHPPGYLLRIDPERLDAARFEAAASEGRSLLSEGRPRDARHRLDEGLALWRGAAFEEFAFEEFARVEAARLDELHLVALEDRLQADLELGDHAAAVAQAESLVAGHPLRERLRELHLLALYRSGRQADALRAYQAARATLADELGIDPGPSLRRLEADILAQSSSLDWQPPAAAPPRTAARRPGAGRHRENAEAATDTADSLFVGRADELARVDRAFEQAASGRGRAVLVAGEPGIGKTSLIREATRRARARGFGVAWGRCLEGGGTPAYWPWVEVVRTLAATADPEGAADAIGSGAAELAQVVPEIKELLGTVDAPVSLDPDTARMRLFQAVEAVLRHSARGHPVVVVLDDLQWADGPSLHLLGHLAGSLARMPVVVVGVYRPADVEPAHPLGDALAAMARHQVADHLEVAGLTEGEVGSLIAATTGEAVSPDTARAVVDRTEGNPFFVTEVARLLQAEHSLSPHDAARALPTRVRDVVRRRLARLPDGTVALLSMAALAGREFDLAVLEAAANLDPEPALERVEAALMAGLVVEAADRVGRFRFSHDLVRETIADDLTALRRAHLHARLGSAVHERYRDEPDHAVELANHFALAVPVTGPRPAITHSLRAAEVEGARLAHEQAEAHLRRALELVGQLPPGPDRDHQELEALLRLGAQLMVVRGFGDDEAGQLMSRARILSDRAGGGPELLPVLYGLMSYHLVTAQHVAARAIAEEMLAVATRTGEPAELVSGLLAVGITALHQGEVTEGRDHLERALALPESRRPVVPSVWLPVDPAVTAMTFLAWSQWLQGDPAAARATAAAATKRAADLEQPFSLCHAILFQAWIAVFDDDVEATAAFSQQLVADAGRYGFALYEGLGRVHRSWAEAEQGHPEAVPEIQEALALLDRSGGRVAHGMGHFLLARAQHRHGQRREALTTVNEALAFVAATGQRIYESPLHRLRAVVLLALDPADPAPARNALERAIATAQAQGAPALEAQARVAVEALDQR